MKIVSCTTNELTQGFSERLQFSDQVFQVSKSNPAKYTPAGALKAKTMGTMPHLFIDQLAKKINMT